MISKKKVALFVLITITLLIIFGKNYISELVKNPSNRAQLINIAKVIIPIKNLVLMRDVDDQIALLKSSGSCFFCDLAQGDFKKQNFTGVDLRYANLSGANLSNTNLSGANLSNTNLSGANLHLADLKQVNFQYSNLSRANLSNTNLSGADLLKANLQNSNLQNSKLHNVRLYRSYKEGLIDSKANFYQSNLSGADLSNNDLRELDFSESNFTGSNLNWTNFLGANLSGVNLSGAKLFHTDLSETNLNGVSLSNKDLTGVNLSGVDLSNTDLTGAILTQVNLSAANLNGVDLSNKDLTGANLSGVDLSNTDLTGAILKDATKIKMNLINSTSSNWSQLDAIKNLNITRFDLNGNTHFLTTKEGFLFKSKNNKSRLALNLNDDDLFTDFGYNAGLLGAASNDKFVYIAYTIKGRDFDSTGSGFDPMFEEFSSLVVDEYSIDLIKVRNIIKIDGYSPTHYGGALAFDKQGSLYLSTGDGANPDSNPDRNNLAQNLQNLKGKILRLDLSESKLDPEIIAYGFRNPFGMSIDSKDRMFIPVCGRKSAEAVYFITDLYSNVPLNMGWPFFEGSLRKKNSALLFNNVSAPIFQTNKRPGCLSSGVYLDDIQSFLFADWYGTIRLLKQTENSDWYVYHKYTQSSPITSFGFDKKTKKIFVGPNNLELSVLVEPIN